MKRREAIVVISSTAMTIAGCGGGTDTVTQPPPPPPTGLATVTGTISLPTGSSVTPESLSLRVMGVQVTPSATGSFPLLVSPLAPTLALATDANGNGIMAGFIDPVTGAKAITPRSTGVVLAWFAMGGPFLPANAKSQVLALLSADTHMDTLGAVIDQRIAVNPHAVSDGDAQIAAALTSVLDAFVPPAIVAGGMPMTRADDNAPLVVVTPQIDQGGVSVRADNAIAGIDLANSFRRPVQVYVYEVQKRTNGVVTDLVPAKLVAGPTTMDEPLSFQAPSSLASFFSAAAPFDPYTLGPIPLSLDGASDQTTYEVVVIGPSANGVIPAFFGAGRYATHVAGWNAAISKMFARTYYVDLVYAFLLELSGFASLLATSPKFAEVGTTTRNAVGAPFPEIAGNPELPPNAPGLRNKLKALEAQAQNLSGILDSGIYKSNAPSITDAASAGALKAVKQTDWDASLRSGTNFTAKLASPFTGAKSSGAISRLFNNLSAADRGVLWTVKLSKQTATINPPSPAVDAGEMIALTVSLSPDLASTYDFDWTNDVAGVTFTASDAAEAASITTKQTAVNMKVPAEKTGSVGVQVTVYDIGTPGHRVFVTRANTSVRILARSTILPNPKALFRGNQQVFTVTMEGGAPQGAKYLWNVTGPAGTIGSIGQVTTTVPSINYTAVNKGDDVLHVQITDASGLLLSRSTALINVDPSAFIDITIAGLWDRSRTPANGHYFYGDMHAVRTPFPESTLDWIPIVFNLAADQTIGILVAIFVPPTYVFTPGQTFTRIQTPNLPTAFSWQLIMALDQNHVENHEQRAPEGTGPLTVKAINHRSDGTWEGSFEFTINNGSGTIVGTTAAIWDYLPASSASSLMVDGRWSMVDGR